MTATRQYVLGFAFGKRKGLPAVLLVEKTSPPWQAGKLNGVGGEIEPGEMPFDAMVREFEEETGIHTTIGQWTHDLMLRGAGWYVAIFQMELDNLHVARQTTNKDKPCVVEIASLPMVNVIPNLRWIIPLLKDREGPTGEIFYPSFYTGVSSKPNAEN